MGAKSSPSTRAESAATTLFGLAFIEEWTTSPSGDKICELGSRRI
jgi:hypothetical protein